MLQLPPPSYTPSSTDHNKISKFRAAIKLDISPAFIYSFSTKQGLHVSLSALQPTETTVCAHQELLKFFPHSSHLDCVSDGVFVAGLYAGHVSDYSPSLPCNMMAATTESVFLNLLVKNEPEDLTGHRERQVKIYFKILSPAFCSVALFRSLYGAHILHFILLLLSWPLQLLSLLLFARALQTVQSPAPWRRTPASSALTSRTWASSAMRTATTSPS